MLRVLVPVSFQRLIRPLSEPEKRFSGISVGYIELDIRHPSDEVFQPLAENFNSFQLRRKSRVSVFVPSKSS